MNFTNPHRFSPLKGASMAALWAAVTLAGCASAPHVGRHTFQDAWGDRGPQVFARDLEWCVIAVESRRSLLAGCMENRGWLDKPDRITSVPGHS